MAGGKYTEVWSIEIGGIVTATEHNSKISSITWVNDEKILAGYEDGKIATVDANSGDILRIMECHLTRVKSMIIHSSYLITGASDGQVKIFVAETMEYVTKFETGCRITCLSAIDLVTMKKEKIDCKVDEEIKEVTEIK